MNLELDILELARPAAMLEGFVEWDVAIPGRFSNIADMGDLGLEVLVSGHLAILMVEIP